MDISSISTNYTVANADKSAEQSNSLQRSSQKTTPFPSAEQFRAVIKDFESYFVEQVIKQMKDTFTFQRKYHSCAERRIFGKHGIFEQWNDWL